MVPWAPSKPLLCWCAWTTGSSRLGILWLMASGCSLRRLTPETLAILSVCAPRVLFRWRQILKLRSEGEAVELTRTQWSVEIPSEGTGSICTSSALCNLLVASGATAFGVHIWFETLRYCHKNSKRRWMDVLLWDAVVTYPSKVLCSSIFLLFCPSQRLSLPCFPLA